MSADQPAWDTYWDDLDDGQRLFREEAGDYVENLAEAVRLDPSMAVLDFGCGFGFVASRLAPRVGQVYLWDAAARMRGRARKNTAAQANVTVLDTFDPLACEPRFDLILVNSVAQYMTGDEFGEWLKRWRALLTPGGCVVVSDLLPAEYRGSWDLAAMLRFSARRGFLGQALWEVRKEVCRYWKTRHSRALTRTDPDELRRHGTAAGLAVRVLPRNLTYRPRRLSALLSPVGAALPALA